MIDFLLGVPGKLKTISDYLTTNWTATKAGYLDVAVSSRAPSSTALSTATWDGTKAGYLNAAISSRAEDSPLLKAPIAANFGGGSASTTSTTFVDALSITGSGVVNVLYARGGGTAVNTTELIIDGVTVKSATAAINTATPIVGGVNATTFDIQYLDQIPFKTSLVIRQKSNIASTSTSAWIIRRTS